MAMPTPFELFQLMFQAHPWHGVSPGPDAPRTVVAFVEIVPLNAIKYELDKPSGHLLIDRPQRYSSLPPSLYGFVPQTYCGDEVAARCAARTGRSGIRGDGDPLDVCVLTEKTVPAGSFLAPVVPIGGFRLVDGNEADDKIIAVLQDDLAFGKVNELAALEPPLVERLEHYFLTYKQLPGSSARRIELAERYDRTEAHEVIRLSQRDYAAKFGDPGARIAQLNALLAPRP